MTRPFGISTQRERGTVTAIKVVFEDGYNHERDAEQVLEEFKRVLAKVKNVERS